MPEGDTIFRAALNLRRWIAGREVTAAEASGRVGAPTVRAIRALVGEQVTGVEAQGKHLLIRFASGVALHTHMRMTGSWHVYRAGERWRKPAWHAQVVLTCGERVAVCFDAPVVEVLTGPSMEARHPGLSGLGPDLLRPPVDFAEISRRVRRRPSATAIGEILLDQRVVAGIGNIYRCEVLFLEHLDPVTPVGDIEPARLDAIFIRAADLMTANSTGGSGSDARRHFGVEMVGGARRGGPWVYRRTGRPCLVCRTPIRSTPLGVEPRTAYWCPSCQPGAPPPPHP